MVPNPTLPACVMIKSVRDDEPTTNEGTPPLRKDVSTASRPHGVDELTPMLPLIEKVVEAMTEVDEAKIPPRAQSGVVVAAVVVPKTVV